MCFSDDLGSDEDNDFGEEEEDEDGGSDYDDKKAKKGKKGKPEKPGKKPLKRKRGGGELRIDKKYHFPLNSHALNMKHQMLNYQHKV